MLARKHAAEANVPPPNDINERLALSTSAKRERLPSQPRPNLAEKRQRCNYGEARKFDRQGDAFMRQEVRDPNSSARVPTPSQKESAVVPLALSVRKCSSVDNSSVSTSSQEESIVQGGLKGDWKASIKPESRQEIPSKHIRIFVASSKRFSYVNICMFTVLNQCRWEAPLLYVNALL